MAEVSFAKLPRHLAIIMDGNGRWARQRGLPRIAGHRRGVERVREIVEECSRLGIGYLTLYAFSAENWSRPKTEVAALMALLKKFIAAETPRMLKNGIRFNVIGDRAALPADVNAALDLALQKTAACPGMVLTLALSYGGRQELVRAARALARAVLAGDLTPEELDEAALAARLDTATIPDPDLLLRTSGETRISNFLLWQSAYAELAFIDINWPDFTEAELHRALADYQCRERRFGKTSEQLQQGGDH